ncbi:MAG: hypothetical protein SV377_08055 [Halobacteria archaeon]|nr:hypothetical protein [Halobacteria archaeon]
MSRAKDREERKYRDYSRYNGYETDKGEYVIYDKRKSSRYIKLENSEHALEVEKYR